jgi:hypothetical protein
MRFTVVATLGALCALVSACEGLALYNLDAALIDGEFPPGDDLVSDTAVDGITDPQDDPETDTDAETDPETDTETDSETDSETDTDTTPPMGDIDLDQLAPEHGTNAGGELITISGSTFTANSRVFFGGVEGTVQSWTNNAIAVQTPPNSVGWVDVRVEDQGAEDTLAAAYRYWTDATGQTALFGSVSWYQSIGNYWSAGGFAYGNADSYMSAPANISEYWELFVPTLDSCSSTYNPGIVPEVTNLTNMHYTEAGSPTHTMNPIQAIPGYYLGNVPSGQFDENASYGFSSPGNSDWPAFDLDDVVSTSSAVTMTTPNLTGNFAPNIRQDSFVLEWNAGSGDYMLATLLRYGNPVAGQLVIDEIMFCAMRDDGYFEVPSSVWQGWSIDNQMDVEVGRVYAEQGTMPHNNGGTALVGVYWVVGAGFQR